MNEEKIFIRNMKNWLIENQKSQHELAKLLNCTQAHVNNIINERCGFSWDFVKKFAKLTNKSVTELFTPLENQIPKGEEESIEESNKDALIGLLKAQLENAEKQLEEIKQAQPTISTTGDNKFKLTVDENGAFISFDGYGRKVNNLEVKNIFGKVVSFEMGVDEIIVK